MRGTHTVVDELRRRVFTEIAKMAYEGGDYKDTIRSLPHKGNANLVYILHEVLCCNSCRKS